MTRPMVRIHNTETNEIIDREMNNEEYAVHLEMVSQLELKENEKNASIIARQAAEEKLALLGLTTDDLKALGL